VEASTAHAIPRLEHGYVTEQFKHFTRTASSQSVRMCFKRLRINFVETKGCSVLLIAMPGKFTNSNIYNKQKAIHMPMRRVMRSSGILEIESNSRYRKYMKSANPVWISLPSGSPLLAMR
jgi:hypothetical protein